MPLRIPEPKDQKEIDRNLFIISWILILPSISLLFLYNGYILALLLIGGFARLFFTAIRLPNGQRGYFQFLLYGFGIINGLFFWLDFIGGWIFLIFFWGFLLYSELRVHRHNRAEQAGDLKPDNASS
jgi:hypothetical protein